MHNERDLRSEYDISRKNETHRKSEETGTSWLSMRDEKQEGQRDYRSRRSTLRKQPSE
jgi:hypothetical protein